MHAFIRSFIHPFIHSFIQVLNSFIHSISSFVPSFLPPFIHSFISFNLIPFHFISFTHSFFTHRFVQCFFHIIYLMWHGRALSDHLYMKFKNDNIQSELLMTFGFVGSIGLLTLALSLPLCWSLSNRYTNGVRYIEIHEICCFM